MKKNQSSAKRCTVLIIDDSDADRMLYRYLLRQDLDFNYHFIEFDCGDDALAWCRTESADVILLDYLLPDWDGLAVLEQLRQQTEGGSACGSATPNCPLPVVMLTGEGDERVAVQAIKSGAQDYLVKDKLTSDLLCRTVRGTMERVRLLEQARQQQEQLKQLNAELEQRVAERTTELQTANDRLQQELSKQQLTQQRLQEQAELLDLAHDAILTLNLAGVITFWNQGAEYLYGWTSQEALGEVALDLLQTQFPEAIAQIQTELDRHDYWEGELTHTHRNGTAIIVASRWVLQRNEKGSPVGILEINNDITERKQAELELQQAKEIAETASQSKSMFLANMSHELRTPLNVILGFTQVLQRDRTLSVAHQETIQTIHRSGDHLLTLINDILDISKIEAGHTTLDMSSFDLQALLYSLETMLRPKAETQGLQLNLELDPQVPQYITTDSIKLRQILINLLSNAIKFTEQGRVTLRVTVERGSAEGWESGRVSAWEHPLSPHPPIALYFEVQDTGVGIDPREIENIFDAFVQSQVGRSTVGGTGLGLTISRRFVELMGGKISVISTPRQGSVFQVYLPVMPANAIDVAAPSVTRQAIGVAPGQLHPRVLVVDDQSENRQLLTTLMTQLGFEVWQATNGQEALDQWQRWHPHLIWMDIQMPLLNGYEATQQIRAREQEWARSKRQTVEGGEDVAKPSLVIGHWSLAAKGQRTNDQGEISHSPTVIIALTAQASVSDRASAISAGCDDFVMKPFRENDLYSKITEHLHLQFLYAEPTPEPCSQPFPPSDALTAQALCTMPYHWLTALHHAAQLCDEEEIEQLIQQIHQPQPSLATRLKYLAHGYQFEQIVKLIQEATRLRSNQRA
ncbi:MAG: response regulator [Leptolyngbyaceae cyanobacterium bins.302]|nr:response regulator [Leptolyngbyaceae cyanobacterium bins.302]